MEIILVVVLILLIVFVYFARLLIKRRKTEKSRQEYTDYQKIVAGDIGEAIVIKTIEQKIDGEYYLVNGGIFEDRNGNTHEIDHILICKNGVYVIETKNYAGDVYGNEDDEIWVQVSDNGTKRHRNPVKQNKVHVDCVKEILPGVTINPLIVMVKNNTQHIDANNVIPLDILPYELNKKSETYLNHEKIFGYYNRIVAATSTISKEEHLRNIEKKYGKNNDD